MEKNKTIPVAELSGKALNIWVTKSLGYTIVRYHDYLLEGILNNNRRVAKADEYLKKIQDDWRMLDNEGKAVAIPSYTDWEHGGPLIEQEEFCAPTLYYGCATNNPNKWQAG